MIYNIYSWQSLKASQQIILTTASRMDWLEKEQKKDERTAGLNTHIYLHRYIYFSIDTRLEALT
jgi:hypothetical protein